MKVWQTKSGYNIKLILSGRSNVFMLSGNGKNILIDGSTGYNWNKLKNRLRSIKTEKLDYLILTHTHFDHAENSVRIKSEYGAKIIVNQREASYLEQGNNILPHGTNFISRFIVNKIAPHLSTRLKYKGCRYDILVDQRYDLTSFGFNAYILHTPGHSSGSQSVIVDDEIALVGDTMFGIFPGSVFPPFADNEQEMIKNWGKLLKETNCKIFLPSHGTTDSRKLLLKEFEKRSK